MQVDNIGLKASVESLKEHLRIALEISQKLQIEVQNIEGDSDLFRKLSMYLTPNLNHWINGMQAGNIKDLESVIEERIILPKKGKK